ncbi:MAG: patatin-like phospholipase family protein [Candidatus Marinimicrobia bacterium]|nr:patatin-like phospholipase family protein [Candidatus Neomarinimicrobiota bacterium]
MSKLKIGLALGGGGARGAAHVGVLQVLHDRGLRFDHIAGSSAGATIGAMYAAKQDPYWIEKHFYQFMDSAVFKALGTDRMSGDHDPDSVFSQFASSIRDQVVIMMARNRRSIIRREKLEQCIDYLLPVKTFNELNIPLEVITADLQTGQAVVYNTGDLVEAVTQSSSIPGFVPPLQKDDYLLVDGGIVSPTPLNYLRNHVDFALACDISKRISKPLRKMDIISISIRSEQVTNLALNKQILAQADFIIRPEVSGLHWSRFDNFERLIQNGREAAEAIYEDLVREIKRHKRWGYKFKHWLKVKL